MDAFLDEQTDLIRLQKEHLHEQRELALSRLRWGRFSDRIKAALQVMTAIVGLAVVVAITAMAWQAHEDHGLTIEAFSVPPDLAQRGLTGQVVASELQDRLSELQAQTITARPASTYANDWGNDIKVEIPETGVSVGELNRYLRSWLGAQTRIGGEIVRTPSGLRVTARAGAGAGHSVQGAEPELDALVQQAAEAVYAQTQPYRWAVYLQSHGRQAEALAVFERLATSGQSQDRPWAYAGWSSALLQAGQAQAAVEKARSALAFEPRLAPAYFDLLQAESALDQREAVLAALQALMRVLRSRAVVGMPQASIDLQIRGVEAGLSAMSGDYQAEARSWALAAAVNLEGLADAAFTQFDAQASALIQDHDITGAERLLARSAPLSQANVRLPEALALEDWAAVLVYTEGPSTDTSDGVSRSVWPARALALARLGRLAEAESLVAQTPLDCDGCLIAHAVIAAVGGDKAQARRWFQLAADRTPSLPFAYATWGWALLAEGDEDGAIEKLKEAHRRGPHFADPLELWGEALMRKGDFSGAAAKFAEPDRDAPRWGRNHLRWGEALLHLGRTAQARAQFQAAAGLELSIGDRAALGVFLSRTT